MNPTLGLEIYHDEADKLNNPAALNFLGAVYESGALLPKDEVRAMKYYSRAMEAKDARGMYMYAKALEKGINK